MSRFAPMLSCLLTITACGDDGPNKVTDAAVVDTQGIDGLPAGCDYAEQLDLTNDDQASGTPEVTNQTLSSRTVICGTFDHTHFDGEITADVDAYTFTVGTDGDVLVRLNGAGAEAIEFVGLDIYPGPAFAQSVGALTFYGDHGVTSVRLPAGTYKLSAFALNSTAITTSVPYKLEITTDTPAIRCPELTTGGYLEANDGVMNNGNDTIQHATGGNAPALTTAPSDAPEPTGITLSSTDQRLSGTAADITVPDRYEDKDTYLFATSPTMNELTVRLTWAGTANLDYFLLEAGTASPIVRAISTANQGPEARTFSIKPSSMYWLFIGAAVGSTVPMPYSASLCPARFTP